MEQDGHIFSWIKDAFSLNHTFFVDGKVSGILKDSSFSKSAIARIFDKEYLFEIEGLIRARVNIIDPARNRLIGLIQFKRIRTGAMIEIFGNEYEWRYTNIINTKWSITDHQDNLLISATGSKEGSYKSLDHERRLLLICGLFINNFYKKRGY